MDRNTIGNEIEAEINASYRYKNLRERELIEIAKEYILAYLIDDLKKIKDAKRDLLNE